jgi:PepSY-associated TM region
MWKTASLRRLHRRLGLFIGIQLLLWTSSGIYFAWTDIDDIHGDHLRSPVPAISFDETWVSPSKAAEALSDEFATVANLRVVSFGGSTFYQLRSGGAPSHIALIDVHTGLVHPALTQDEATELALAHFAPEVALRGVELLEASDIGAHHEYRGGQLPVWVFDFDHASGVHVYVSAEGGEVIKFRTRDWRIFDFLWMLHTMDYIGRDDINNPLLRGVSLFALMLAITGFWLWKKTRRPRRQS